MAHFAGIDIGSTTTELVILNENGNIVSSHRELTSGNIQHCVEQVLLSSSEFTGVPFKDYDVIIATGYGRKHIQNVHKTITEITCYAKGAHFLNSDVRTIIDIGGQDSKVISLEDDGSVSRFLMNDKCAAGTGRFLEMVARIFDVNIDRLGELSLGSDKKIKISNVCTVFAESEIISLFSQGVDKANIVSSAHRSISERVLAMLKRIDIREKIMFCGGVAGNIGMRKTLEDLLGTEIIHPEDVFMVGALGAAVFSMEWAKKEKSENAACCL